MRNQRLIIVIILSLFFSMSTAQDKFKSYKDIKKIPDGMNLIHDNNQIRAIVGVHGFYPIYWVEIHHEWVQPFNWLIDQDIKTFFYKYDWNECPSEVATVLKVILLLYSKDWLANMTTLPPML